MEHYRRDDEKLIPLTINVSNCVEIIQNNKRLRVFLFERETS